MGLENEREDDRDGHDTAGNTRSVGVVDNGGGNAQRGIAVTPLPSSIVQAICQIMVTVDAVKKSQRNQHGGYQYASTDDIYAAITRKMGEVGLVLLSLEDKCEVKRVEKDGKTSQWAHMEFSFVLATTADTWSDARARRTLYIQVTGPQTFQAAQSYAEKSYLRSLFKLPTGDMDLDSMPQADNEDDQVDAASPKKRRSSYRAKKDGDDAAYNELRGAISGADGPADLAQIVKEHWPFMQTLPARWKVIVDDEISDKYAEFETSDAAE
jgi:hypothetical protein